MSYHSSKARAPAILYKYVNPQRIDIINNLAIRMSQPSVLNDPYDSRPVYILPTYIREEILRTENDEWMRRWLDYFRSTMPERSHEEIMEMAGHAAVTQEMSGLRSVQWARAMEEAMKQTQDIMLNGFDGFVGICSLSEIPTSSLMWSHYASNHFGLVLGFEVKPPLMRRRGRRKTPIGFVSPVRYTTERPSVTMDKHTCLDDVLLTKSQAWNYEMEWRIIQDLENASLVTQCGRLPICLFRFPASQLREVYIGARMGQWHRRRVFAILRKSRRLRHVAVFEMEVDVQSFDLNPIPIPVPGRENDPHKGRSINKEEQM